MTRPVALGLGAAAVLALAALAWSATHRRGAAAGSGAEPAWPPLPRRVTVEVLNGGGSAGEARDAALRLRRGGLDVVTWENAPEALRDSTTTVTRILVRGGDTTGVGRIGEVLGPTEVVDAPDATRLVDLSVVVPRDSAP